MTAPASTWSLLVVDPDARVRADFRYVAHRLPVRLRFVDSAEEALDAFAEDIPDVVIAEQPLRGMSGLNLLDRLHVRYPRVKRILFTAERELPKSRPMDVPVLEKPCPAAALQELLSRIGETLVRVA